jgi:uncharacterized protein YlxW (UPF0749 family)
MSVKTRSKVILSVATVLFGLAGAGCGSNPPCQTDIAAVDAARGAAQTAEAKLEEAKRRQADLQNQIQAEQARQQELKQRKAELEAKIAELGG